MDKEAQEKIAEYLASELHLDKDTTPMPEMAGDLVSLFRELGYCKPPKDKPLLLSDELIEIWERFDPERPALLLDMIQAIAQAQRKADIKHYEGGNNGQSNSQD